MGKLTYVCQKFLLETLGYGTNQALKTALRSSGKLESNNDKRGKTAAANRLGHETIQDVITHIKSYNPQISHYRRVHAPNRLYLPPTLNIAKMHKAYLKNEGCNVSYVYRREVNNLNISFAKLGEEECEVCISHDLHICSLPEEVCEDCISIEKHRNPANIAHKMYKEDAANNYDNDKFSADLQKVVMLPRMPGIKTVVFTKRITAYNETFAPLGTKEQYPMKASPFAVRNHKEG